MLTEVEKLVFNPPELGTVLSMPGLPGGGSKIYDRSPYGHIGTITDATWKRLPSGLWYLNFNGTSALVDCGNIASINAAQTDFTIRFWIRVSSAAVSTIWSYNADDTLNPAGDAYLVKPSDLQVGGFGQSGLAVDTNTAWNDGVWHMLTIALGSTAWNLYKDDALAFGPQAHTGTQAAFSVNHLFRFAAKLNQPAWYAGDIGSPISVVLGEKPLSYVQYYFHKEKHLLGVW